MRRRSMLGTLVLASLIVLTGFTTVEAQGRRTSRSGPRAAVAPRSGQARPAQPATRAVPRGQSRPVGPAIRSQQRGPYRGGSRYYGGSRFYGSAYYDGRPYFGMRYFYPWGFYTPWYYQPYPYHYGGYMTTTVRIQAEPKNAEVYIDGRFAGVVDEFDGFFQGLRIEPGGHELKLYLDGYRSISQRVYVGPGENFKWRQTMERLAAGEANEPRPVPPPESVPELEPAHPGQDVYPAERPPVGDEPGIAIPSNFGQLAVRVQPADADVLIDDEPWHTPEGAERLVVHLKPGTHRIEIRKEGHDSFVTSVDVKNGETAVLNVSLSKFPL